MTALYSAKGIATAIDRAKPGEWIMYHYGFLMMDRPANRAVNATAQEVYRRYKNGDVTLVATKIGFCEYKYHLVKL